MSLSEDIKPYRQLSGLISNVMSTGQYRTCDNGPLFTGEYIILSSYLKVLDIFPNLLALKLCTGTDGELHRAPNDTSPDETDDYHGALAAFIITGVKPTFKVPFRLWRQPQLLALAAIASQNLFYRILATPLIVYAALVIATSCINAQQSDYDSRILSWLLIQGTKSSALCRLASLLWRKRLMSMYPNGMKDVFTGYFGSSHPLAMYMEKDF